MESSNQNVEIIQDFDNLINQVEVDIKDSLEKYNQNQVLGQLSCFQINKRDLKYNSKFRLEYFDSYKSIHEIIDIDRWLELELKNELYIYSKPIQLRIIEELKKRKKEKKEKRKNKIEKDQWSESTKVVDYLNQVRLKTVDELKRAQKESLEKICVVDIKEEKNIELGNETPANKFYFQVHIQRSDELSWNMEYHGISWIFNIYIFVTDFYISQSDIDLLE